MASEPLQLISELLGNDEGDDELIKVYGEHVTALLAIPTRSDHENRIVNDYISTVAQRAMQRERSTRPSQEYPPNQQARINNDDNENIQERPEQTLINALKGLMVTSSNERPPPTFDGERPRPRKWLEDFKDSMHANQWSEDQAIKKFPTYLTGAAYAWYKTEVRANVGPSTKFSDLIKLFNENYLGPNEYSALSRQVNDLHQRQGESVSVFIPKMRELLLLLEPELPEREQVRQIRGKLRGEYRQWIAHTEPETINALRNCCLKVESSFTHTDRYQPKTSFKRRPDDRADRRKPPGADRFQENRSSRSPDKTGEALPRRGVKCYECNKFGHIGKECPVRLARLPNDKVKSPKKSVNLVCEPKTSSNPNTEVLTINHQHSIAVEKPTKGLTLNDSMEVYECGKTNHKSLAMMVVGDGKFVRQPIKINDVKTLALVDTGAFYTAISSEFVEEMSWPIDKPAPALVGANGQPLQCKGTTELKVELTLGSRTKRTIHNAVIVEGLAVPLLVGMQFMAHLEITIDCKQQKLHFVRTPRVGGLQTSANTLLPANSISFINVVTNARGTIMIIPHTDRADFIVANAISKVEQGLAQVMVANLLQKDLELSAKTSLALYEEFEEDIGLSDEGKYGSKTFAMIELSDTNEIVNVGEDLSNEQICELRELLNRHCEAFSVNSRLGNTDLVEHQIDLVDGAKPVACPLRRRALSQTVETRRQVNDMLEKGIIEPSNSPWASAYVLARKKNGEYRLCVDFRRLNAVTKKCAYPLPHVDDCIEKLAGKKYFSLLDFNSGFWQLRMEEKSKEMTAFRTEDGHFQFTRMPFGLVNAPASFQRMVNALFSRLKGLNFQVFIDDCCIASDTWEEHLQMIGQVLTIVKNNKLTLKGEKCTFGASRIVFLGHEISSEGIRQEQSKLRAIRELREPSDVAEVRRFLGMCSYYRKFVHRFSEIAAPLVELTKKAARFQWGDDERTSFKDLIAALARNATLAHFRHDAKTMVKTDASKKGIAGMLLQKSDDIADWKIVACCSRRLSASELNYGITDLEGLAIVYTVQRFRHYLLGKPFDLLTDHCALCILNQKEPKSGRLHRWAVILSEFDMKVIYTKGSLHNDIDCLSRAPVEEEHEKYADRLIHLAIPTHREEWKKLYGTDRDSADFYLKARRSLDSFTIRDGLVYRGDALYVPPPKRALIIKEAHASPLGGHGGIYQTLERLSQFWWPSMRDETRDYVTSCEVCQRNKTPRTKPSGTMHSFEATEPLRLVALDCLGPLTTTARNNKHLILAVDSFTRFIDARALPDIKSATVAEFFADYCGRYGVPHEFITDNASTFKNVIVAGVIETFGAHKRWATPHHSQSNAQAERAIQTFQQKIRLLLSEFEREEEDWDLLVPAIVLSQNTSFNSSIGCSPYELLFGRKHRLISSEITSEVLPPHLTYLERTKLKLNALQSDAIARQEKSINDNKKRYDACHKEIYFEPGELVLVKAPGRQSKLAEKFLGPFEIQSRRGDVYTLIRNSEGKTSHFERHIQDIKKFHRNMSGIGVGAAAVMFLIEFFWPAANPNNTVIAFPVNQFTRVDPLIWVPAQHAVSNGKGAYDFKFIWEEPCSRIQKANTWRNDYNIWNRCENSFARHFEHLVELLLKSFKNPQSIPDIKTINKRAVLEFVAGYFASDFLGTFKRWFTREPEADIAIKALQTEFNLTKALHHATQTAIVKLRDEFLSYSERTTELSILYATMMSEMAVVSDKLRRLAISLQNGQVDVNIIRSLNPAGWPLHADASGAVATGLNAKYEFKKFFEISLQFVADRIDPTTKTYRLHGLTHWRNLSGLPELVEYRGPKHAIYNHAVNCAKGFEADMSFKTPVGCNIENYIDPALKNWVVVATNRNPFKQPLPTQYIESFPYVIVNCFTRTIRIDDREVECPWYPIRIPANIAWSTNDAKYTPFSDSLAVNLTINATSTGGPTEMITSVPAKETLDAIRKLFELTEKYDDIHNRSVLFQVQDHELTFAHATGALTFLTGFLIFSVGATLYWSLHAHHRRDRETERSHNKLLRKMRKLHRTLAPHVDQSDSDTEPKPKPRPTSLYPNGQLSDLTKYIRQLAKRGTKPTVPKQEEESALNRELNA